MALLLPSRSDIGDLRGPHGADASAVAAVADTLARLDDDWTVYAQPRIGQDVPDFVAVHDRHGVVVVLVARANSNSAEVLAAANRYRRTIYEQCYAFPGDPREPSDAVRAVVAGDLEALAAELQRPVPAAVMVSAASLQRLRRALAPAGVAAASAAPVQLSANAQLVAANPRGARVRGATGPAGSGKSFALTARAARLAAEGKDVLVLCFNLTLAARLRMLVTERCAEYGAEPTRITCTSFHTFCARVVDDAIVAGFTPAESRGTWPQKTLARTNDVFEQGYERSYDAVLVDEGQDFTLDWWDLLRRHVVRDGGEMLLVSDPTVDLGGKDTWSDPAVLRAAGFDEPWIEMGSSYRMAGALVEPLNEFARLHLHDVGLLPTVPDDQSAVVGRVAPATRTWRNIDRVADLGVEIGRQVVELLRRHPTLSPRDVVFLCEYHHDGLAAAEVIEDAGYPTHHVYSRDPDARVARKARFWPSADAVKGCTVHSFKGWESPAVVVGIAVEERSRRLAYAGMTRVSSTHDGASSHLVVVNADPRLAGFQPTFELGVPVSRFTDDLDGRTRPDLPGLPSH